MLTKYECQFLLESISEIFGHGYAPREADGVGGLQAKLSIMGEAAVVEGQPLASPRDWKHRQSNDQPEQRENRHD